MDEAQNDWIEVLKPILTVYGDFLPAKTIVILGTRGFPANGLPTRVDFGLEVSLRSKVEIKIQETRRFDGLQA